MCLVLIKHLVLLMFLSIHYSIAVQLQLYRSSFLSLEFSGFIGFIKHPSWNKRMFFFFSGSLFVHLCAHGDKKLRHFVLLFLGPPLCIREATNTQAVLLHVSHLQHASYGLHKLNTL